MVLIMAQSDPVSTLNLYLRVDKTEAVILMVK